MKISCSRKAHKHCSITNIISNKLSKKEIFNRLAFLQEKLYKINLFGVQNYFKKNPLLEADKTLHLGYNHLHSFAKI
jgi:hypothetical protein